MRVVSRRTFVRTTAAAAAGYSLCRIDFPSVSFASTPPYTPGAVPTDGVTIKGTVRYEGKVPKPITKDVTSDFAVAGRGPRQWEGLNLSTKNEVTAAVVVVNGITKGKPFTEGRRVAYAKDAMIFDRCGVFGLDTPEVVLEFENRDPIMHSWMVRQGIRQLTNVAQVPGMPPLKFKVKEPGLYELTCGPHPWERAFRLAVPHPYYAMTASDGTFEIRDIPRGRYKASIWAEGIEPTEVTVDCSKNLLTLDVKLTAANLSPALRKNLV